MMQRKGQCAACGERSGYGVDMKDGERIGRIQASDLARQLAERAEHVCRHYLSNGRRVGSYWIVGDVRNAAGRSMFVRLRGHSAGKRAGKWTDAATAQGARLIGIYDSQVAFGQSRVLLVWTRLIMPNGRSIVLERQQGADASGYSGLEDEVDNHWAELFKAASCRPSLEWVRSSALELMAAAIRILFRLSG